jgi:mRNA interferase HigB
MKVLVKKTLHFYIDKYPNAEKQLIIWHNDFSEMDFSNFNELKQVYGNASILNNNRASFQYQRKRFSINRFIEFLAKKLLFDMVWYSQRI